ncbi:unnamed protein product [Blepharisma stoltei]|uniref:GOLD domain-containing protein n=1 Tax=Blepharisma stoltei TaxID=1481888 RepID=A0AAU9IIP9_9CILI|nr:unnamed protein product [Blepharisma stoltei]
MSENPIFDTFNHALKSKTITEAIGHLREAEALLDSSLGSIDLKVIACLKKIVLHFDFQIVRFAAKLYNKICSLAPRNDPHLLLDLSNDIFLLCENLKGTEIAEELEAGVKEILVHLIQHGGLEKEQLEIVQQLLDKKTAVNYEEALKPVIQDIQDKNIFAINRLMDMFSSIPTLKEQFLCYGTQLEPVLDALALNANEEMLKKFSRLLENFIFRVHYNVKLGGFEDGSSYNHIYKCSDTRLLYIHDDIFYTSLKFVQMLQSFDKGQNLTLGVLIRRLWENYPKHRPSMYDLLIEHFKKSSSSVDETIKGNSAKFLYVILHSTDVDGEFKGRLETEVEIENLFKHDKYDEKSIEGVFEAEESVDIDHIQAHIGFPLSVQIPSGEKVQRVIEVQEPNSILVWGFATEYYDISYSLSRVDLPQPQIIIEEEKVSCDQAPCLGVRLLHSPGLYRFIWNNEYSWFRSKHLRFKVSLIKPTTITKNNVQDHKEIQQLITITHPDKMGDLCYSTPSIEVLEIGVHISQNQILMLSHNIREESLFSEDTDLHSLISQFIEKVTKNSPELYPIKKIGIVEKSAKKREGLDTLGAVAVARDVDAVALFSEQSLHSHTLISVVNDDGLRSCVVHKGRILLSEDGECLGDVSRLNIQDPIAAISTLLSVFGPAVVVISGKNFIEHLAALIEKVRPLVPAHIWQKSVIRESVYASSVAVEAASKLHYLHYRYKFAL